MKRSILLSALIGFAIQSYAQYNISGNITDNLSNPLTGANVTLKNTYQGTTTDLNGDFVLKNLKKGVYELNISFIGFETTTKTISLHSDTSVTFSLSPENHMAEEVIVLGTRAGNKTPSSFTDVSKENIDKTNMGEDMPVLLNQLPSVVTTTDAGNGIGYTGMRIRGSDMKRINVTINGIPFNDSESHSVYWVDIPDIASSVQSIQIQRGVGTSTNGGGAFGATVNMQTDNVAEKFFVEYSGSAGSFNTFKNSLHVSSGLIQNHYFVEAKAGQIKSDGYRDRGWSDLKSYFIQAGYIDHNTTIKLLSFGGWEETYQAWYGVDSATMNQFGRKYNPAGFISVDSSGNHEFYDDMKDHYQQDHLQLHFVQGIHSRIKFNTGIHFTYGRGFYQDYVPSEWYSLDFFGLPDVVRGSDTLTSSNLVQRLWLKNYFYGGVANITYSDKKFTAILGGAANNYAPAHHFGEVIWAEAFGETFNTTEYYRNKSEKLDWNGFLKLSYQVLNPVNVFVDIQYRHISYQASGLSREYEDNIIDIQDKFNFFNPKLGTYLTLNPNIHIYASYAVSHREPNRSDYLKATGDNYPEKEVLNDTETGIRFKNNFISSEFTLYNMSYKNQLVLTGELDEEGNPLRKNVKNSYRRGLEFVAGVIPERHVRLEGNITLSSNKINDYPVQDSVNADVKTLTTDIAFSPSVISSTKLTLIPLKNLEISLLNKYVGKQYLDNTGNEKNILKSYSVFDFLLNYTFQWKKISTMNVTFKINNLFNELYASNGYMSYGTPYYYPQAGTNVLAGLSVKF